MIEEPMRKGAMLDLVFTNKEGLVGNVKFKGSLSCSDHEMVEFKIHRAARRVCSKLATLDFRRADWSPEKSDWQGSLGERTGRERGPRKLVGIQGSPPPRSGKEHPKKEEVRQNSQQACMDEQGPPGQAQDQKGGL
ncbi:pecanex-like protein hypothetical protein [Limosa lapponica baueri]|uniref:Glycerol kinase n=1 Tax=Limosa lapponica baueri TaxID=1758121 RepID=A0A2I0UJL3_LIMLA|nr:pecanex-like protein hypothetical protein [Limosa lapponica baueri]